MLSTAKSYSYSSAAAAYKPTIVDQSAPRKVSLPSFDQLWKDTMAPSPLMAAQNAYTYSYPSPPYASYNKSPANDSISLSAMGPGPLANSRSRVESPIQTPMSPPDIKKTFVKKPVVKKAPRQLQFEDMTSVFVSDPNFESDVRKFKCDTCDKRFKTLGHLSRHKYIHTASKKKTASKGKISKPEYQRSQSPVTSHLTSHQNISKMELGSILG